MPAAGADRPLDIAIVRARYNPAGGAERFVQRALAALSARGVNLTVIARDWPQAAATAAGGQGAAGERAVQVGFERVDPFHLGSVWRDAAFARGVHRVLARRHFDLVQSHERIPGLPVYRAGDGVHAIFLARRARALPRWRRVTLWANPYHAWMLHTERRMFEHPALRAVICNSTMVRDEIARRFAIDPVKLRIVRNGIDATRFAPPDAARREQARAAFGLGADGFAIAFVGSGFERKGLRAALQALAHPATPREAVLLVAGGDKAAGRYRALAARLAVADRVRFLGEQRDVVPVLHAADAFVLPTLYDPFPNAVLEALACGLPVVTSTGSGAAEIIDPGRNGFVTDALDAAAIARALAEIGDPARRAPMRAAARAAIADWTIERMGSDLLALYRELLGDADAGR
jgi:UDP-glucose:(heptosyl)LPS alpha-1,3-glucosyltransferase